MHAVPARTRTLRTAAAVLVTAFALVAAACDGGAEPPVQTPSPTPPPPVSPTTVPTTVTPVPPPETPASPPPTSGSVATDCVNGWVTPPEGTAAFETPLDVIRRTTGVKGPLVVADMRFFEGPESPPSDKGYILVIQRWYVKLYAKDAPAFQGRFLVESRRFGSGVSTVAPYDTQGWRSPDWVGFQFDSADTTPKVYPGLPGEWEGIPYDFVEGGGGLTISGLPEAAVGCLTGT